MEWGKLVWWFGFLIAAYLVLTNWKGANAILGTLFGGASQTAKTLQGR